MNRFTRFSLGVACGAGVTFIILLFSGCSSEQKDMALHDDLFPYTQEEAESFDGVLIEDFSDVQCGHCKTLRPLLKDIHESFPEYTVRSYPFPFLGVQSSASAIAIECVKMQDKTLGATFEDQVFALPRLSTSAREETLESLGGNVSEYKKCVSKKESDSLVQAMLKEGKSRGVNSTPTLFINGEQYTGPRTKEGIVEFVDSLNQ